MLLKEIFVILLIVSLTEANTQEELVKLGYLNHLSTWWPPESLAQSMGIPEESNHGYNLLTLTFWGCDKMSEVVELWENPLPYFTGNSIYGTSKDMVQKELKKKYNEKGIKILVSAFGTIENPSSEGKSATTCARSLANFVRRNNLDGVDIAWHDDQALQNGSGERWLITFTAELRRSLPNHILSHSPPASYFKDNYRSGGYKKVNEEVGNLVDFYSIHFFNEGYRRFETYQDLFVKSSTGSSVSEIIAKGVPANKIVIGKVATQSDTRNGYVSNTFLGSWIATFSQKVTPVKGVSLWEFSSDMEGQELNSAIGPLEKLIEEGRLNNNNQNKQVTPSRNTNNRVVYPIRLGYVNTIRSWWPGTNVLAGMGVPGYNSKEFPYNYIVLTFWIDQPVDMVKVWSDPVTYIGTTTEFGTTKAELQKNIKKRYNEAGIKLLISAFGGTTHPTTFGNDPKSTAEDLADFVANNNLDGVDVDWEDSAAMERGTGEEWLITFTTILRQKLPNHIITHAPQAPYFVDNRRKYPNGAYLTVNKKVGHMIDFYNVQFYNQGNTRYDTYELLFKESKGYFPGTSVEELIDIGIPAEKIVVGKPATRADVYNTGYVDASDLGNWTARYFEENSNWYAGVMFWQLKSDIKGTRMKQATDQLVAAYQQANR